jgi:outer membrane protein TolC
MIWRINVTKAARRIFSACSTPKRTLLEAQDRLAASQTQTATALVAFYKALVGGVPLAIAK